MGGDRRLQIAATVGGFVALAVTGVASAGPPPGADCTYDGTAKTLTVTNSGGGAIYLEVDGDDILVNGGSPIPCDGGSPTVNNVDLITFTDIGSGASSLFGIVAPATFAPGATDAGDFGILNPNEIEWGVHLGDGEDVLVYYASGDPQGARVTIGTDGINHNVSDQVPANDLDVTVNGIDMYSFEGGNDGDDISGDGGDGTGNPLKRPFAFFGIGAGIYGASGDDHIVGGSRDDSIRGSWGADYIKGGDGVDTADWDDATAAVKVDIGGASGEDGGIDDLSAAPPSTAMDTVTGTVESLTGSDFDDRLEGDDDANVLTGGLGADRLLGRGGSDRLKAKDGVADLKINCGPGDDKKPRIDAGLDPAPKNC